VWSVRRVVRGFVSKCLFGIAEKEVRGPILGASMWCCRVGARALRALMSLAKARRVQCFQELAKLVGALCKLLVIACSRETHGRVSSHSDAAKGGQRGHGAAPSLNVLRSRARDTLPTDRRRCRRHCSGCDSARSRHRHRMRAVKPERVRELLQSR
jgi:hypothetical protein